MATGSGRAHKPYVVNVALEQLFKTEGSTYEAISGPIQEQPSFNPKNDPLKVKKHDELGANHKVKKGATAHTFGFKYSIENWKGLFKLMGGIVERPLKLTTVAAGSPGVFQDCTVIEVFPVPV